MVSFTLTHTRVSTVLELGVAPKASRPNPNSPHSPLLPLTTLHTAIGGRGLTPQNCHFVSSVGVILCHDLGDGVISKSEWMKAYGQKADVSPAPSPFPPMAQLPVIPTPPVVTPITLIVVLTLTLILAFVHIVAPVFLPA